MIPSKFFDLWTHLIELLLYNDSLLKQLLETSNDDVINLDFVKAFNKINHGMICYKLGNFGIAGKPTEELHGFLKVKGKAMVKVGIPSN